MKKKPLGRTGILVSELCLGTMTFGTQTSEVDAHKQSVKPKSLLASGIILTPVDVLITFLRQNILVKA
jgi:aryl-alcohol dehydrogenase-like predicted oxidoreductase